MRMPPIPRSIRRTLAVPLPFGRPAPPLRDPAPDPGLFGPGSVTWRVMREPLLMLGAGRALLMQAAHPLVAQGAIEHSSYATDPYGRFERTIEWVTVVCFGTTAEAEAVSDRVVRLHRRVAGSVPAALASPRYPAGAAYSAGQPALLRWVHASFVDTMLATHDALVGDLDEADRDRFVREWDAVGTLMGVPRRLLWPDAAALRAYVQRMASPRGSARPGPGSQIIARTVLHPPAPSRVLRPSLQLLGFLSLGLLPEEMRRAYGFPWSRANALAHAAACGWIRTVRPTLPRRLRVSPIHELALARAESRWPQAA